MEANRPKTPEEGLAFTVRSSVGGITRDKTSCGAAECEVAAPLVCGGGGGVTNGGADGCSLPGCVSPRSERCDLADLPPSTAAGGLTPAAAGSQRAWQLPTTDGLGGSDQVCGGAAPLSGGDDGGAGGAGFGAVAAANSPQATPAGQGPACQGAASPMSVDGAEVALPQSLGGSTSVSPGDMAAVSGGEAQGHPKGAGEGKKKGKGKKGKGLDLDLDLPDLDSEPDLDLSEHEPEADDEDGGDEEEEEEEDGARASVAPVPGNAASPEVPGAPSAPPPAGLLARPTEGAASGAGADGSSYPFSSGGGVAGGGIGLGSSRNGSVMYGSGSDAADGSDDDRRGGAGGSTSSSDEGGGYVDGQRRLLAPPGESHRRRKRKSGAAGGTAAAASGGAGGAATPGAAAAQGPAATAAAGDGASGAAAGGATPASVADLDAPANWADEDDYIYKDVDPNDLDIGIEFPLMDFKAEDLELPPDEFADELEGGEGEDMVIGEDGKPVRRVRLSAAALAEGEAFIGLEGLVSWGREGTFRGTITRFDPTRSRLMWLMLYEDGDEEWGAVTEDRNGWRVHGGLRPVTWLNQPPPPTDPLSIAAAAADAIPGPVPPASQRLAAAAAAAAASAAAPTYIANLMGADIEVAVGRDGQTRYGSITDFDPNRPRYKWYIRYIGYAEPAYGGTGEWGCLDEEKITWHTHGYKRPVLSVTGGVGGLLPVAPPKPAAAAAAAAAGGGGGFTPRKGPFGRTGLGLLYLLSASEPAADGKFRLPVMALGTIRGAYGSAAGAAAAGGGGGVGGGGKAAAGYGLTPTKPERVSSQAMAGVPDEYGATLVGAKITITVGRGQGHKRSGTVTEYDANRPKYRWRLTFDAVGEPAHGGAAEWGMLSEDQSLWLAHGYKRNITALSGVPERKPRPTEPPTPPPQSMPPPPASRLALSPAAPAVGGDTDPMDVDGGGAAAAATTAASPDGTEGTELRQCSPTEGPEGSPAEGGEAGAKADGDAGGGGAEGVDTALDAALAAAAEAAVAIFYEGNLEVAAKLGVDTSELDLGVCEVEELGTNLIGARLLVSVGRGGARRSGTITDYEPNRPRYKWRLVYDAEVLPVGVNTAAGAAAPSGADGAANATATPAATPGPADAQAATPAPADGVPAGDVAAGGVEAGSATGPTETAAAPPPPAAAAVFATAAPLDVSAAAAAEAGGGAASAPADATATLISAGGTQVVEGEWGTLSDDRTAWLCHGYRRAILASEGVPVLPPAYLSAAAVAAAAMAAQSPARKRRPGFIDEQSVAAALLTLGKRARREAKAAATAAREARQAEIAAAGGHVVLVRQTSAPGTVPGADGAGGDAGAAAVGDGGADGGGDAAAADADRAKRVKLEPAAGGEVGLMIVRQSTGMLVQLSGLAGGEGAGADCGNGGDGAANVGPVSPVANPEGVVGLEVEVDRGDGRHRGRVLSYDAKKPRLRWLVRYQDGNQEWGTFADDLSTLRVYGFVRTITWTSRPPAVLPKGGKGGGGGGASRNRSSSAAAAAAAMAVRSSPAAPGIMSAGAGAGATGGAQSPSAGGAPPPVRTSARRSSENGDSDWVGGAAGGCGSGGTDYRYIFRRNGMCRAQITHQGCAIISPYYDTPEAAAAAADYYNYKLRGTAAHLNLGLTSEQRVVLDQLTLEQLQAYIKGRGDIHDLSKALLQYAGEAGQRLYAQLQQHALMLQELQRQQLQQQGQQQGQQGGQGAQDAQKGQQQPQPQLPPQAQLAQQLQQHLQLQLQLRQQQALQLQKRQQQQLQQQQQAQQPQPQQPPRQTGGGEEPEAAAATAAMAAAAAAGHSRAASADPQDVPPQLQPQQPRSAPESHPKPQPQLSPQPSLPQLAQQQPQLQLPPQPPQPPPIPLPQPPQLQQEVPRQPQAAPPLQVAAPPPVAPLSQAAAPVAAPTIEPMVGEIQIQVEVRVDDDDDVDVRRPDPGPGTDGAVVWDEVMADMGPL